MPGWYAGRSRAEKPGRFEARLSLGGKTSYLVTAPSTELGDPTPDHGALTDLAARTGGTSWSFRRSAGWRARSREEDRGNRGARFEALVGHGGAPVHFLRPGYPGVGLAQDVEAQLMLTRRASIVQSLEELGGKYRRAILRLGIFQALFVVAAWALASFLADRQLELPGVLRLAAGDGHVALHLEGFPEDPPEDGEPPGDGRPGRDRGGLCPHAGGTALQYPAASR